jgi:hypothetical protein
MPRSKSQNVANQLSELGGLAPEVIARRVALLALGPSGGSARQRRELTRMSSEKVEAAWLAWSAMGLEIARIQWSGLALAWSAWMPTAALPNWTTWWEQAAPQVAQAGLGPYVRIAKANRVRLSRSVR